MQEREEREREGREGGTASERCNEIEGSYDKIIITIEPSYTTKKITHLLPLALLLMLRTHNNIDSNKLVIVHTMVIIIYNPGLPHVHIIHNTHNTHNTHLLLPI